MMASVLPFIGGIETARADEGQNQSVKAKSDLDQAREKLEAAQVKKTQLEEELKKAQDAAKGKEAEIQKEREKIEQAEADIKEDEEILAKDQEIKELDKKIEELRQREKEVKAELEAATQTYENAQKALQNPGSTENLTSEQRVKDLKKQYDIAEDHHENDQKKKKALEKELENLENELYKAYGQKKGIEEFFKEFEENPAHINRRNTPEYLEFKDKALAEAKTIEDKYKNIEKEIEKKKQEIKENQARLEESDESSGKEYNAYKKEDLSNEFENKYKTDEKLAEIELDRTKKLEEATKKLEGSIKEREEALKKLEEFKSKEAEKQKDLEKSSALAQWLNEKAADDKDGFAKANKELLRKIAQGHEERKKY